MNPEGAVLQRNGRPYAAVNRIRCPIFSLPDSFWNVLFLCREDPVAIDCSSLTIILSSSYKTHPVSGKYLQSIFVSPMTISVRKTGTMAYPVKRWSA